MVCQTVSWVEHYFSDPFLKLAENEYCSKVEIEFRGQFIYTPNISYFLESCVGGLLAWLVCLRWWHASVDDMPAWMKCQHELRASMDDVGGEPMWLKWAVY